MMSKRQLIDAAFEELALAGYTFDIDPDEQLSALRRLDSMMATWGGPGIGIRIGYNATIDRRTAIQTSNPAFPTGRTKRSI